MRIFPHFVFVARSAVALPSMLLATSRAPRMLQGAEFWGALESVFRPFEGIDLDFLRTSATLEEDSAMRVLVIQRRVLVCCLCS